MENIIYQRTRDRHNNPNGIVIAMKLKNGKGVKFGWSKTNTKAGDVFNKAEGLRLATQRAIKGSEKPIPQSIQNDYSDMVNRGVRYFFKGQSVKVVPVKS